MERVVDPLTVTGRSSLVASEAIAFAVMLVALIVAPWIAYPVFLMKALCFALFACAFNLLIGYVGLLSFGHALFFGWAGYVAAHLAKVGTVSLPYWFGGWNWLVIPLPPLPPELAVLGGACMAGLLGLVAGLVAIRRQGIYFAMITLALAQMMFFFAVQAPFTGGEDGIQAVPRGILFDIPALFYSLAHWVAVLLYWIAVLGLLLPSLAVQIRRLHDLDKPGWFWLIYLVPLGPILLLVWNCMRGTAGDNRFGPESPTRTMNFRTAVRTCLGKYADFSGRASRSELWFFVLFYVIAIVAAGVIYVLSLGPFDLSRQMTMYYFVLAVFIGCFLLIYRVINSPFGEVLKAIRENEARAISLGYKTNNYKLVAFVLSATLAGVAGGTKAIVFQLASLTDVHWSMSGEVVLMTLVGGLGTVFGPVAGAFAIITMENYLAPFGQWVTVIQGGIFVVCVLLFRRGVVGELANALRMKL